MSNIDFNSGIRVTGQFPLDPKTHFNTLEDLGNLGDNNSLAFTYYEGMLAFCQEDNRLYVWREQTELEMGVLPTGFVYPVGAVAEGIDYSNRRFNFIPFIGNNGETYYEGGVVAYLGSGYDYEVSPIILFYMGELHTIPSTALTLNNADNTNDRFDLFVLNVVNRTVSIITGIPSANPLTPYYNPENFIVLATVLVKAGSTSPDVNNILVYDENAQVVGGEWNTSSDAPDFGFEDITNPNTGLLHIFYGNVTDNTYFITFDADTNVDALNFTQLIFAMKLAEQLISRAKIHIYLTDGNDNVVSNVVDLLADIVFDNQLTEYQNIIIPFDLFNTNNFQKLVFRIAGVNQKILFDTIQFSSAVINVSGNNTWTGLDDTYDNTFIGKENSTPVVFEGKLKLISPLIINGNPFTLKKHPSNNDPTLIHTLEVNDFAINGFWNGTEYWSISQFIGSNKDVKNDWKRIVFTEGITTV